MNLMKLLDVRGTKVAFLILAAVADVAWVLLFFSGVDWLMANYGAEVTGLDTTMMLGIFMGAVIIGYGMSRFANDGRGLTYGIYGGLAGMLAIAILMRQSGLLAALVGLMAVLGGFNGATLGESFRRAKARNKKS